MIRSPSIVLAVIFFIQALPCIRALFNTTVRFDITGNSKCDYYKPKVFHPFMYNQCVMNNRDDKKCRPDSTFGMQNITCDQVLHVQMESNFSSLALSSALGDMDSSKYSNPPMMIKIAISNIMAYTHDDLTIERQIDEFITHRPWWKLVHESIGHAADHGLYIIVLERYPVMWRPYLDFVVRTQYLSADQCRQSPLIAGRMSGVHPGMMPVLTVFSSVKVTYPFSVFIYYWPIGNAFVSAADCPNILNKWECAFLKMTNCSMPKFLTDCADEECLSKNTKGQMWVTASDKADIDGEYIEDIEKDPKRSGRWAPDHLKDIMNDQRSPPDIRFIAPHDKTIRRIDYPDIRFALFNYLFMTRPNAMYRLKMKKLIHEMRSHSKPHFHPSDPCVAVHIRRGDRIHAGIDMMSYCRNVSHDKDPKNVEKMGCVDWNNPGKFGACPAEVNEDLGCKTIPFEAVRLKHVISKIPRLVNAPIRDVIVFTDDPVFLMEQASELAKTEPEWRIHTLKAPDIPPSVDMAKFHQLHTVYEVALKHVRSSAGTDSGVLFHSSLKAAQQCSALIAHFGSGVASLFYHSMCVEHAGRYWTCPPAYDFRWGLE